MLYTWTGLVGDNNFNTPGNWFPNNVPGSGDDAVISLLTPTTITVTTGTTVNSLTTSPDVTVSVGYGQTLSILDQATIVDPAATSFNAGTIVATDNTALDLSGGVVNSGLIALEATYYGTTLNVENALTLSGGGTLDLVDFNAVNYLSGAAGSSLDNTDNLIDGAGNIGNGSDLALINAGIIDATGSAHGLTINTAAGVTNSGLIESTTALGLFVDSTVENAGGTIAAGSAAAVVLQDSADVIGGLLTTSNGGVIETPYGNDATLDGVVNAGLVLVNDNAQLHLRDTFTNAGTLAIDGTYYGAQLYIDTATVTLTGGGVVEMLDVNGSSVIATSGTTTLDNFDNLITGAGNIGNGGDLALINASTIDASGAAHGLTINAIEGVTNTGLLESTTSQGLFLDNTIENVGGTIGAFGSFTAVVLQAGADVIGGLLTTSNGGVIETPYGNSATLDGVRNAGLVLVNDNAQLHLRDTITNAATLAIDGTYYGAQLYIDTATVTLTGGGIVEMLDVNGSSVIATSGTTTLDNVNNLITGAGNIGNGGDLALINASTIDASGTADGLTINAVEGVTNTGLLESTTPLGLLLDNTIENAGGTIGAFGSGSAVVLQNGADVIDGEVTTSGGVIETPYGNNATLDGVLNTGLLLVADNANLHLRDTFTNAATLAIDGTYYGAYVLIDTPTVTLTGGGVVEMLDINGSSIIESSGTTTLDNVNNLIIGAGNIGNGSDLALINASTIDANGNAHGLTINAVEGVTNTGLLESTTPQGLFLDNTIENAGGTIGAFGSGSAVVLQNGADVIDGEVTTSGGVIETPYGNNATLDGVLNTGLLLVADNANLHLRDTFTNAATLAIDGTYYGAYVLIDTPTVTLTGGGVVEMLDINGSSIIESSGTTTLDNVNNLIFGAGNIGNGSDLALINASTIDANGNAHGLTINAVEGVTNTGLLESTTPQGLFLDNTIENAGGTIGAFGSGSAVVLQNGADVIDGEVTTSGGVIETPYGNNATLDGVLNTGLLLVADNANLHLRDTFTNAATLAIDGTYYGAYVLIDTPTVTLTGGGVVEMLDINGSSIIESSGTTTLDNVNNLIIGAGNIGNGSDLALINASTIDANGNAHGLTINAQEGVTNTGLLESTTSQGLFLDGSVNNAGGTIAAFGSLTATVLNGADISGGILTTTSGGLVYADDATLNGSVSSLTNLGTIVVTDNENLTLVGEIDNQGTIAVAGVYYGAQLIIGGGTVTLTGGGTIALVDSNDSDSIAAGTDDVLDNVDNTIIGSGDIGEGNFTLVNSGTIEQTGSDTLLLNLGGGGTAANSGLFESTSASQLELYSGTYTNTGTFAAIGGVVDVTGNATLTNLSDDVLTGGTYEAVGSLAVVQLNSLVTTDAADIILSGTGATVFDTHNLVTTLGSIGPGGTLALLDGQDFAATNTITDAGTVALAAATLSLPALDVSAGGSLYGTGVVSGPVLDNGQIEATADPLVIQGNVDGSGDQLIDAGATLEVTGTVGAGVQVTFGGAGAEFVLDQASGFAGTLDTLVPTDIIVLTNTIASTATIVGATLDIGLANGGTLAYALSDAAADVHPVAMLDGAGSEIVINSEAPCYGRGTRILTARGEVAVEALVRGDLVATFSGSGAPLQAVQWVGYRRLDIRAHPQPERAWPVRIRAGALSEGVPRRDLIVSPDHALYLDGMLIHADTLVNGASIVQEPADVVEWFHVELNRHDVLMAEGALAESYLDTGNRGQFENSTVVTLFAELEAAPCADACAAFVREGKAWRQVASRLVARAAALGWRLCEEPALHLEVDGQVLRPSEVAGRCYRFALPEGAREVCIASRASRPSAVFHDNEDRRTLGVGISAIRLGANDIAFDDPRLSSGFHAVESKGALTWRWTDGAARLLLDGNAPTALSVNVAHVLPYWVEPTRSAQTAAFG